MMEDKIKKHFEEWAKQHQFILAIDKELNIYSNVYTQGAWMAYEAGWDKGCNNG
jgi:hypothetical protein